ncbi:MAG TPA: hypothetical protein VNE16_10910 [Vicinamibacterales bacterium]|nr:hypothetical protein [Vicinamibacterales bacterium]
MATATETVETNGRLSDRAIDMVGRASHLAHEVKLMKTIAADAAEDGARAARRAVTQTVHRAQDLMDETTHQIKRRPLKAIGVALLVGSCAGLLAGWLGRRAIVR